MKLCHIVPENYIGVCTEKSHMHMTITQEVLKNKEYQTQYLNRSLRGDFVILDNGSFEYGEADTLDNILKAAELIHAAEIVLPDCMLDGQATIERVETILEELSNYYPKNLDGILQSFMAVPQGKNEKEYMKCLSILLQMPEIDTIGFSYGVINKAFEFFKLPPSLLRPAAISYINQHFDLNTCGKQFHCLGIGGHPHEIEFLKLFGFIRSVDSSKAFVCAINNTDIKETLPAKFVIPTRPDNYFNLQVSEDVVELALKNIQTMEDFNKEQ